MAVVLSVLTGCYLPRPQAIPPVISTPLATTVAADALPSAITESPATATSTQKADSTQPAAPTPSVEPSATPEQVSYPLTQYTLNASLVFDLRQVLVVEGITYVHAAPEAVQELLLVVEANRYPGCFQLIDIRLEGDVEEVKYQLRDTRLVVTLPKPLGQGEQAKVVLRYRLDLPPIPPPQDGSRPQPFGYTSRQVNLVDWYPYLPPYRPGQGWQMHDPWFFGEHQVYESADYTVTIRLEGSGEVAGQPIQIAASAPARLEDGAYIYRFEKARSFAWSASPVYQVLSEQVGDVIVQSYAFPFHEEASRAALRHTADALRLYQELFAPYPHQSLAVVEADFLDGMEYDGLFFLSRGFYNLYEGTPAGYLTAIAVHETAHQWWYGLVGNDQALEPWLDEALCTYSEALFYERVYPDLLDWWWMFRVNYYQPTGVVNGRIFDFPGFRPYRDAVYLRGAQFLEALRDEVGDEAFFAFLQDYARRFAFRQATAADFFEVLAEHSSVDTSRLLKPYFEQSR